jgi:hypothetical protein
LATENFRYVPLIPETGFDNIVPLNHYRYLFGEQLGYMLAADARIHIGEFVAIGEPADPRINRDYARFGGSVGPVVQIKPFPDYPIEIGAVYTDFQAASGFNKDLGNFQASVTLDIGTSKVVGLTASYTNGRREDTPQRVDTTSIGLTLQY